MRVLGPVGFVGLVESTSFFGSSFSYPSASFGTGYSQGYSQYPTTSYQYPVTSYQYPATNYNFLSVGTGFPATTWPATTFPSTTFASTTWPAATSTFPSTTWPATSYSSSTWPSTTAFSSSTWPASTFSSSSWPSSTSSSSSWGKKQYPKVTTPETVGGTPADFCNQYVVRKYNLDLSAADIATLNDDVSAEEYVPCSLTTDYGGVTSRTYTGVGCRYKGAVGSLLSCLDENTGRPNGQCRKLSVKVHCRKFRDDKQRCDDMTRLNFHGMAVDKSLVSERVAYNMLRAAGLPAPCAAHGEVYINGKFDGIFAMVQNVETSLTKEFFGSDYNQGKGAIYKAYWFRPEQANLAWLEDHHDGKDEHQFMLEVTNYINKASTADCTGLARYFDLDEIAQVTAMNDLLGNVDDWRLRHNFFWYVKEDAFGKRLVMIPWDYDRLDDQSGGLEVRRKIVAGWTNGNYNSNQQVCTNPSPDPSLQGLAYATGIKKTILQRKASALPPDAGSPIECDKITRMLANCMYDKVKSNFNTFKTMFPSSAINSKIDSYSSQISSVVAKDSSISSYEWSTSRQSLKNFFASAPSYAPTRGSSSSSSSSSFGNFGLSNFGLSNFGSSFGGLSSFGFGG